MLMAVQNFHLEEKGETLIEAVNLKLILHFPSPHRHSFFEANYVISCPLRSYISNNIKLISHSILTVV